MPKVSNTSQDKKAKLSSAEEKEGRKSLSKPKSESSYSKFVDNSIKISNKSENNGRKSASKAEEGEKQKSRSKSKRINLKHPKKTAERKSKHLKEKSPSLRNKNTKNISNKELLSDVRSKSASRPRAVKRITSLGKKKVFKKKELKEISETDEENSQADSSHRSAHGNHLRYGEMLKPRQVERHRQPHGMHNKLNCGCHPATLEIFGEQ